MIQAQLKMDSDPMTQESLEPLKVEHFYEILHIDMGSSYTNIFLKDIPGIYNSVCFDFFEDNKPINIYGDKRFNPYLSL